MSGPVWICRGREIFCSESVSSSSQWATQPQVRGTANMKDAVAADLGGIGLGLNALAMKLNDALEFTSGVSHQAEVTWLTGHSLGGAFVQMVGAILACRASPGTRRGRSRW